MKFSGLSLLAYLAMIVGLHVLQNAWVAFAVYHGLILVFLLPARSRVDWKELVQGWDPKIGIAAIAFGLAGGGVLIGLAPVAGINKATIEPVLSEFGLHGVWWLLFVVYHALVNPWFEELLWRGKLGSNNKQIVLNDVLFAGYHILVLVFFLDWPWIVAAFGMLTLAGWLWRQLKRHQGGLLVPVVSHMAADAGIMMVVFGTSR